MPITHTKRDKRLFGLAELLAAELNKSKGDVQPEDILSFMQCHVPISEEESSEEYDEMMKDRWEKPAGRGSSAIARLRKSLGFVDGDSIISVIEKAAEFAEKPIHNICVDPEGDFGCAIGHGFIAFEGFHDVARTPLTGKIRAIVKMSEDDMVWMIEALAKELPEGLRIAACAAIENLE
jgi:hypothetical protein